MLNRINSENLVCHELLIEVINAARCARRSILDALYADACGRGLVRIDIPWRLYAEALAESTNDKKMPKFFILSLKPKENEHIRKT